MRRPLRRLVYLLLCGQDPRTRISAGTRIRIWVGTEMRGMRRYGVASRRRRLRHTEPDSLCQRRRFGTRNGAFDALNTECCAKGIVLATRNDAFDTLSPIRRAEGTDSVRGNGGLGTLNTECHARETVSQDETPPGAHGLRNVVSEAAHRLVKRRLGHTERRMTCGKWRFPS